MHHAAQAEIAAGQVVRVTLYLSLLFVPLFITSPDAMFGYADVPKITALRVLAAVAGCAWITHAAAGVVRSGAPPRIPEPFYWAKWLIGSAAGFLVINLISTALSVSPRSSLAGAFPGFDSTGLYSLACYLVLAGAAARFMVSRKHFEVSAIAIAVSGAIASGYGALQIAGLDPFSFDRFEVNDGRSPMTFGNPSFAGSFLTISLFVSAGVVLFRQSTSSWTAVLSFLVLALNLLGVVLAASRGAWVGIAVATPFFLLLVGLIYRARVRESLASVAGTRLGVVFGLAAIAAMSAIGFVIVGVGSSNAGERLASLNVGLVDSGLNGRQATWQTTLRVVSERPAIPGDDTWPMLRHVFGYGPDTFRYAFQLNAPDEHVASFVPHAHNSILNVLTEQGVTGLLAWVLLNVVVLAYGVTAVRDRFAADWARVLAAAATAGFLAHAVDQFAAVPRVSDSLAMWVLVGLIVALTANRLTAKSAGASNSKLDHTQRENNRHPMSTIAIAAPPLTLIVIVAIMGFTIYTGVTSVLADSAAARLHSDMEIGIPAGSLLSDPNRVTRFETGSSKYHALEASALETAAAVASGLDPVLTRRLSSLSLNARQAELDAMPLSASGHVNYSRALLGNGQTALAIQHMQMAVRLSPNYWAIWVELAGLYAAVGDFGAASDAMIRAEEFLDRQAEVTRTDPATVKQFDAVRAALASAGN